MSFRPRLLAVVVASAALLSACGEEEGSPENLFNSLAEPAGGQQGLPADQAQCIVDHVYGQVDEDTANQLAQVRDLEALSGAQRELLSEALQECEGSAASAEE